MSHIKKHMFMCFSLLFACILIGCANNRDHASTQVSPLRSQQEVANYYDKQGIISHPDYWHLDSIDKAEQQKPLSDQDLDWLFNLLQKPSTDPPLRNARVMGIFLDMKVRLTPPQRQRIVANITPLLSSKSKLDRRYAGSVLKKLEVMGVT